MILADLIHIRAEQRPELDDAPEKQPPAAMQAMEPPERKAFVQQKIEEREAIQDQIDALTKDRDVYVRAETERLRNSGKADGFDGKVLETIRSQAAVAGIQYE